MSHASRDTIASSPMATAWREAAKELRIRFQSPFGLEYEGKTYWCSGWLPDFGGPKGTVIAGPETVDGIFDVIDALEYYSSGLNPDSYEEYDRSRFVETLNDWGWFGKESEIPDWFSGRIGEHGG